MSLRTQEPENPSKMSLHNNNNNNNKAKNKATKCGAVLLFVSVLTMVSVFPCSVSAGPLAFPAPFPEGKTIKIKKLIAEN